MQLLISARQVLVGPAGDTIPDGAVLVDGDRIVAVGPRAQVAPRAERTAVEWAFPRSTVLPGLVNCHVHLAFDAGADPIGALQRETDDTRLVLSMAGHALDLLGCGVTTARDLGDRNGLAVRVRDAIAAGHLPGPRLLTATAPLTPPGGHCWFLGGEVDGEQQIREQVRRNAAAGADLVKVMASGGQSTPGGAGMAESQFSTAELVALVDEAHVLGLPVAAHAHGVASIESAVAAGVDTLEHCTFLAGPGRFEPSDELADGIAARGIAVCPGHRGNWRALAQRIGEERARRLTGRTRWLADRGVRLIAGTDAGLTAFDDFPAALARYVDVGFRPAHVIAMATVDAAAGIGLATTTGRLAAGLAADLLVVDGDPLDDLAALAHPTVVIARGRVHTPHPRPLILNGPDCR